MSSTHNFGSESRSKQIPVEGHNSSTSSSSFSVEHISISSRSTTLDVVSEFVVAIEVTTSQHATPTAPMTSYHAQENFEWVSEEVRSYRSVSSRSSISPFARDGGWVMKEIANKYAMAHYFPDERVCHLVKEREEDFIYIYETVMRDLGVTLPFDTFEADVLRTLGVAPTQLHPNNWASIQPFEAMCHCLSIKPSANLFLSHYTTCIGQKADFLKQQNFDFPKLCSRAVEAQKVKESASTANSKITKVPLVTESAPVAVQFVSPVVPTLEATLASQIEPSNVVRRKVTDSIAKEARCKKGKVIAPSTTKKPTIVAACSFSKGIGTPRVVATSGTTSPQPEMPPTELARYAAPALHKSLWDPDLQSQSIIKLDFTSAFDRGVLLKVGAQNTRDMMSTYHICSLVAIEFWGSTIWKADQIIQRGAVQKVETNHMQKACKVLKFEVEVLKSKLEKSKSKFALLRSENAKLKEDNVEVRKTFDELLKDLGALCTQVAEQEVTLASNKTKMANLKEDLKTIEGKTT
ncbi:hypothetical protein CR513_62288, partial [Mucuna pruriens]